MGESGSLVHTCVMRGEKVELLRGVGLPTEREEEDCWSIGELTRGRGKVADRGDKDVINCRLLRAIRKLKSDERGKGWEIFSVSKSWGSWGKLGRSSVVSGMMVKGKDAPAIRRSEKGEHPTTLREWSAPTTRKGRGKSPRKKKEGRN